MKRVQKTGAKTRAQAAQEKETMKTAKRQKTLFAPRKVVESRDIVVDTGVGKIKVEPAIEVKVEVNSEDPAETVTSLQDASIAPAEVIVKEEVDVTFEMKKEPPGSSAEETEEPLVDKVQELESVKQVKPQKKNCRKRVKKVKRTCPPGPKNRKRKRVRGPPFMFLNGTGGPIRLPKPKFSKTVYSFYRTSDFKEFLGLGNPVRRVRIFPCAQEPNQLFNNNQDFWNSAFQFIKRHGSKVRHLQLAQEVNQSTTDFANNAVRLLSRVPNLRTLTIRGSFTQIYRSFDQKLNTFMQKLEMKYLKEVKLVWTSRDKGYDMAVKALKDYAQGNRHTVWNNFQALQKVKLSCEEWAWERDQTEPREFHDWEDKADTSSDALSDSSD